MTLLHRVSDGDGRHYGYSFPCRGCNEVHQIMTNWPKGESWEFNGNLESPTFSPSYLTWLDPNPNALPDPKYKKFRDGFRCHSFITDGQIQYLDDCTHELAGQTMPMMSWEEYDSGVKG